MVMLDEATLISRAEMIVTTCGGIHPPCEAFYISSILYAAERSENAFSRFDAAVTEAAPDTQIVATVQEALTHAAALSRFFWPMKKKNDLLSAARGARLRDAFGLDDASPLRGRTLRNAFEHFDEDLDRFLLGDHVGLFLPTPIVAEHALADDALSHIFKLVDPAHGICVLLGEKYEFRLIRAEVERVLALAKDMQKHGSRLQLRAS